MIGLGFIGFGDKNFFFVKFAFLKNPDKENKTDFDKSFMLKLISVAKRNDHTSVGTSSAGLFFARRNKTAMPQYFEGPSMKVYAENIHIDIHICIRIKYTHIKKSI